ncbi:MAG: hypothetical protein ACR2NB_15280 [Solirubrobacteraceae bacterium]
MHGRWRVERAAGSRSADPWEVDAYRRERSAHFVIWTPAGVPAPVDALEAGYARLRAVLDRGRLRRRYLVVVARDPERGRRLTRHIRGLDTLTTLTDTQVRFQGPAARVTAIDSQRVVVIASRFAAAGPTVQQTAVTHELTHAALAPATSGRVPGWLIEGIALYTSQDDRRAEAAADTKLGTAPTLRELSAPDAVGRLEGDAQSAAYAVSSAAAYAIAERHGRAGLLALLEAYSSPRLPGRAGDPRLTDRALRRVLGTRLDDLQASL